MFADAVLSGVLQAEANPIPLKSIFSLCFGLLLNYFFFYFTDIPAPVKVDSVHFKNCLMELLTDIFGREAISKDYTWEEQIDMIIDGKMARIDLRTLEVHCDDEPLHHLISTTTRKLHQSLAPPGSS